VLWLLLLRVAAGCRRSACGRRIGDPHARGEYTSYGVNSLAHFSQSIVPKLRRRGNQSTCRLGQEARRQSIYNFLSRARGPRTCLRRREAPEYYVDVAVALGGFAVFLAGG